MLEDRRFATSILPHLIDPVDSSEKNRFNPRPSAYTLVHPLSTVEHFLTHDCHGVHPIRSVRGKRSRRWNRVPPFDITRARAAMKGDGT